MYDTSLLTGGSQGKGGTAGTGADTGGTSPGEGGGGTIGGSAGEGEGGSSGTGQVGATGGGGTAGATGGTQGGTTGGGTAGTTGGSAGGAGEDSGGEAGQGGGCAPPEDCCPSDVDKTEPGVCGCGVPDTDTDGDGVPDCIDTCMGLVDADCSVVRSSLIHRYSFGGTGTVVTDSRGTAHGEVISPNTPATTLSGTGTLTLTGTITGPYVNLPNGLISVLTNATLEAWVTWSQSGTTGQSWQRIFDFGTSGTQDMQISGSTPTMSYLFLTTRAGTAPTVLRLAHSVAGPTAEAVANGAQQLVAGTRQHVAAVIDDQNDTMSLYLNGAFQGSLAFTGQLSAIDDINNWLGRSQYATDYEFVGIYDEFRIYDQALSLAQLRASFMGGPDAAFLVP